MFTNLHNNNVNIFHFFLLPIFILFILFLAALGLHCCTRAFLWLRRAEATLCCGARASHCGSSSCFGAQALGTQASVAAAHRLSSCGLQLQSAGSVVVVHGLQLLRGMQDLPGPGLEPVSPALAGRFLTTVPPGKPNVFHF